MLKMNKKNLKRELVRAKEEVKRIQSVPLVIGQLMEMVDSNYAITGSTTGSQNYVRVLSTLNREELIQEVMRLRGIITKVQVSSNSNLNIPKEILKKMLIRENELRLSSEVQARYENAEKSECIDWLKVTEEVQKQVIEEFGYLNSLENALYCLRSAAVLYPDDPEFKEIPLYVKYNRARDGSLKEGDRAPNTSPVALDGTSCELLDKSKPTVLIAGSIS